MEKLQKILLGEGGLETPEVVTNASGGLIAGIIAMVLIVGGVTASELTNLSGAGSHVVSVFSCSGGHVTVDGVTQNC